MFYDIGVSEQRIEILATIEASGLTNASAGELIINPRSVAYTLGASFQYAQPIEAEVAESFRIVQALWSNMSNQDTEFFQLWLWQEAGHAATLGSILDILEIETRPQEVKVGVGLRVAGILARATPGLSEAMEVGILSYMAMGEEETKVAYTCLAHELTTLKEHELARVMGKMARQESFHGEYQRSEAQARYKILRNWQKGLVSWYIERFYRPVGVNRHNQDRRCGFGRMLITLTDDEGEVLASDVQKVVGFLEIPSSKHFVKRRYDESIEALKYLVQGEGFEPPKA